MDEKTTSYTFPFRDTLQRTPTSEESSGATNCASRIGEASATCDY